MATDWDNPYSIHAGWPCVYLYSATVFHRVSRMKELLFAKWRHAERCVVLHNNECSSVWCVIGWWLLCHITQLRVASTSQNILEKTTKTALSEAGVEHYYTERGVCARWNMSMTDLAHIAIIQRRSYGICARFIQRLIWNRENLLTECHISVYWEGRQTDRCVFGELAPLKIQ